jgi:hypothetical protein
MDSFCYKNCISVKTSETEALSVEIIGSAFCSERKE